MTALKVLLVILLFLFLAGLIRAGGSVEYSANGLLVRFRVGCFWFQIFPLKKKPEKAEKKREKKGKKKPKKEPETGKTDQEKQEKKGGTLELVKMALPLVGEAAGALKRRIRIDKLLLDFTAGGRDAAGAALAFGYSNAAVSAILPVFQQNFDLKEYRIRTRVDFSAPAPVIYLCAAVSARIGQLVTFAVILGYKALLVYLKYRKQTKLQKEAN